MRALLHVMLVVVLASGLAACGNKGKLKSPTQIQLQQEKKARKEAKEAAEKKADENETPSSVEEEGK